MAIGAAIGLLLPTLWVSSSSTQITCGWSILAVAIIGTLRVPVSDYVRRKVKWLPDPPRRPQSPKFFFSKDGERPKGLLNHDVWITTQDTPLLDPTKIPPRQNLNKTYRYKDTDFNIDQQGPAVLITYAGLTGYVGVSEHSTAEFPFAWGIGKAQFTENGVASSNRGQTFEQCLHTSCSNLIYKHRESEEQKAFSPDEPLRELQTFVDKLS